MAENITGYYAAFNKRFGWRVCHNGWCRAGETSIVATVLNSGDDDADLKIAQDIAEGLNLLLRHRAMPAPENVAETLLDEALDHVTDKPWDDHTLLHARISEFLGRPVMYAEQVNRARAFAKGDDPDERT